MSWFSASLALIAGCSAAAATQGPENQISTPTACDIDQCDAGYECIDNGAGTNAYCRKPCGTKADCATNEYCYPQSGAKSYCALYSATVSSDASVGAETGAAVGKPDASDSGHDADAIVVSARDPLGLCRNPQCDPNAEDAIAGCAMATCDADLTVVLGANYKQHSYTGGACSTYATCKAACACGDTTCSSNCLTQGPLSKDCYTALSGLTKCMKKCTGTCSLAF